MRSLGLAIEMFTLLGLAGLRPFVGVLLWEWISFMDPHQLVYGFASGLPWALMSFVAILVGCVVAREPRRIAVNNTTIVVALFIVCISITSLTAMAPGYLVFDKWDSVAKGFFVVLLTASLLTDRRRIHALVWMVAISLGYYGVKGGVFAIASGGTSKVFGPPASMIADNNHLAAAMLVSLPLMNYLRLQSAHRLIRAGLAFAMALTVLAVLASYSRGALLGLGVMVLFLWWNSPNKIGFGIVVAVVVASGIAFMPEGWMDRMHTIQTYQEDASATDRLTMWATSWKLAVAHPLTGAGFMGPYVRGVVDTVDPNSPARAVHSIWFEVLGEHGFPTFLVWFAITLTGVFNCRRLIRLARGRADLRWAYDLGKMVQVSIPVYLVAGSFLSLCYWEVYPTILVAVAAARMQVQATLRREARARRRAERGLLIGPAPAGSPAAEARPGRRSRPDPLVGGLQPGGLA